MFDAIRRLDPKDALLMILLGFCIGTIGTKLLAAVEVGSTHSGIQQEILQSEEYNNA